MRFGAFVTPNHRPGDDPTLALERDLKLVLKVSANRLSVSHTEETWFGVFRLSFRKRGSFLLQKRNSQQFWHRRDSADSPEITSP